MKVQLIVVRGKPEGKVIPLAGPKFKIGRGETCHLRPNSEQVSREHAEFTLESNAVIVRDLGSRNGTLVNGKALTTEACKLKDRDLVQVGPLTFAVSIQDAPKTATKLPCRQRQRHHRLRKLPRRKFDLLLKTSPTDDIDSWLLGENAGDAADQPTAVYGGDTITIAAFKDSQTRTRPAKQASLRWPTMRSTSARPRKKRQRRQRMQRRKRRQRSPRMTRSMTKNPATRTKSLKRARKNWKKN